MGDGIKFLIDLQNRTSGPSPDVVLDKTAQAADKANRAVAQGAQEFSALKSNIFNATVAGQLWAKGLEMGAQMAVDGIRKVGDVIKQTVNVAADERRESMSMMNLLGGKAAADEALAYMEKWGELSEFNDDKTQSWGRELLNAGYRGREWKDAMAAMADAASMAPDKMAGAEEAMSSLARMKMTGKVDARALRGLRLSEKDVVGDLADALGMSPGAVKKGLEEGAIPAAKAYEAVLRALERKTGKNLGEAGVSAGKGLDAKLTHWREWPRKIMKAVSDSPGMDKIEKSFDKLLESFDPSGEKGGKMVEGLGRLMDTVGTFIEDTDWGAVTKSIGGVASSLGAWIDPLSKVAAAALKVTEAIAKLPEIGDKLGGEVFDLLNPSKGKEFDEHAQKGELNERLFKIAEAKQLRDDEIESQADLAINTVERSTQKPVVDFQIGAAPLRPFGSSDAGGGNSTKVEAKAEVHVHVNGGTGSPKEVGEAVKAGTQEGMTAALEKTGLHQGTASAKRKR